MPWVLVFLDSITVCDLNLRLLLESKTLFSFAQICDSETVGSYDFFEGLKGHTESINNCVGNVDNFVLPKFAK